MSQAQATPVAPAGKPGIDDVQPVANETLDRIVTGTITVVPFLALFVVGWQVWNDLLHWSDVAVFLIMYFITGLGVTVGFHRHFTHRASRPAARSAEALAIMGSMAIEGPVTAWVADHRKHHAFSDKEGDPHSPHVGHGGGWRGAFSGLFHAHVGWLFIHTQRGAKARYAPDLMKDPLVRWVDRTFLLWVVTGLAAAFVLGWIIGGSIGGGLDRPAVGRWGADARGAPRDLQHQLALPLLRRAALSHRRPFAQPALAGPAHSRRVLAQQPPRLPHVRGHGLRKRDMDPSAAVIRVLERLGLVWDVVRISPERQAQKAGRLAVASTAQLRRELEAALPDRPFALELWDGTRVPATAGTPSPSTPARRTPRPTCCAPPASSAWAGPTCPGRSSPTTWTRRWSCSTRGSRRRLDRATRARLALAAARACGPMRPPRGTGGRAAAARKAPQPRAATPARFATTTTCRPSSSRCSSARS